MTSSPSRSHRCFWGADDRDLQRSYKRQRRDDAPASLLSAAEGLQEKRTDSLSLAALPSDCCTVVYAYLRVGERARLASTCFQCFVRENEEDHVESRRRRVQELVDNALRDFDRTKEKNDGFRSALTELDYAGTWGAPGLLEILPHVAPLCEILNPNSTTWKQSRNWADTFRDVAARWLPSLNAEKLVEKAISTLARSGPLPVDVQIVLRPGFGGTSEARIACHEECVAFFLLSLLPKAATSGLTAVLSKLTPDLREHCDQIEGMWTLHEEINWEEKIIEWRPSGGPNISNMALETLRVIRPHLRKSDVDRAVEFLDPYFVEEQVHCIMVSMLVLSELGSFLQGHEIVLKVLKHVPHLRNPTKENLEGHYNELVCASFRFISCLGLKEHLDYILKGMEVESGDISDTAADALRKLSPLLNETEHAHMVEEVLNLIYPDDKVFQHLSQTFHGAFDLVSDFAYHSHGREIK